MGTTLTGTTPQDTYDSLIKVTDNGPLSGTAKYLSDGLGNDSALALSTAQVGVGTTTLGTNYPLTIRSATADYTKMLDWGTGAGGSWGNMTVNVDAPYETILTSGAWAFKTGSTEKVRITSAGNVGIGTSSPASKLTVRPSDNDGILISSSNDSHTGFFYFGDASSNTVGSISYDHFSNVMRFNTGAAERFRITANGVTFNGDTAAANALDDYEEGTFTPVFRGATSAGSYTFAVGGGSYTKIGNQVTVWISLIDITESSAGSGEWQIGGLPFTSRNAFDLARVSTACWIRSSAAARDNILCGVFNNSSNISFLYDANGSGAGTNFTIASDFLTNMDIGLQVTYYV